MSSVPASDPVGVGLFGCTAREFATLNSTVQGDLIEAADEAKVKLVISASWDVTKGNVFACGILPRKSCSNASRRCRIC